MHKIERLYFGKSEKIEITPISIVSTDVLLNPLFSYLDETLTSLIILDNYDYLSNNGEINIKIYLDNTLDYTTMVEALNTLSTSVIGSIVLVIKVEGNKRYTCYKGNLTDINSFHNNGYISFVMHYNEVFTLS